jgi:predicted Zn-dependent peptidase
VTEPRRVFRAAMIVAALLVGGLGSAAGAQEAPRPTGTLPGGVTYQFRPDPAQPAAAVALWYRAPATGFDDAKPVPGLARLAATTVAASTPITGTPLGRLVQRAGGRLSVSAYPDSVAITALVAPDRAAQVVRALTAAYFAPVTDAPGLQVAQREVAEDVTYRAFEPSAAIEDALAGSLFTDGPFHAGLIAAPKDIGAIPLASVRAFAERAFRPANAILVLTGNIDAAALGAVASREGAQASVESPAPAVPRPLPSPVARPANVDGVGLGWSGPPITDEASATALDFIADALFGPRTGAVQKAVGSRKASVTGRFVTYRNPGVFLVTISGDDGAAVRPLVEAAIAAAAKPMPPAAFAAARAAFVYHLLSELQTPAEIADTYGWYTVEGAPAYAPADGVNGRYFTTAATLTPQAVAAAAARYLSVPPAVVTLATAKPSAGKRV